MVWWAWLKNGTFLHALFWRSVWKICPSVIWYFSWVSRLKNMESRMFLARGRRPRAEIIRDSMFFNRDTQGKLSNFTRTDFSTHWVRIMREGECFFEFSGFFIRVIDQYSIISPFFLLFSLNFLMFSYSLPIFPSFKCCTERFIGVPVIRCNEAQEVSDTEVSKFVPLESIQNLSKSSKFNLHICQFPM